MPTRTTALDSPEAEVSTIRRELYHAVPGALARTLLLTYTMLATADDPDFTALCLPPVEQGVGASVLACLTGWRHVKLVQKYLGERDAEAGPSRAPSSASSVIGRIGSQGLLFGIGVLAGQWWA